MIYMPGVRQFHFWAIERLIDRTQSSYVSDEDIESQLQILTIRVKWYWLKTGWLYG